jgi:hypothetical protein
MQQFKKSFCMHFLFNYIYFNGNLVYLCYKFFQMTFGFNWLELLKTIYFFPLKILRTNEVLI